MRGWTTSRGAQHVSAKEARSFVTTTQRSSIQFRRPEQVRDGSCPEERSTTRTVEQTHEAPNGGRANSARRSAEERNESGKENGNANTQSQSGAGYQGET